MELFPRQKSKPFGVLAASNIIVSLKSLVTEMTPLLDTIMPKNFDFNASSFSDY